MSQPFLISFKPEISLQESSEENQLVIQSPERKLTFKKIHPNLKNAISSLVEGNSTLSQLLVRAHVGFPWRETQPTAQLYEIFI